MRNHLTRISERLGQLEKRLRNKAGEVSGVECIRSFLKTGRDPYAHLGSPDSLPENSIRRRLFGRKDNDDAGYIGLDSTTDQA